MPRYSERLRPSYETEKSNGKRRREGKRSQEIIRVRRRNWIQDDLEELEEFEELDSSRYERILSRKERALRRMSPTEALVELKEEEELFEELAPGAAPSNQQGTVVQVSHGWCRVRLNDRSLICDVPGLLQTPNDVLEAAIAIGDEVTLIPNDQEHATIETILPRRNLIVWPGEWAGRAYGPAVANADLLLIVISWREPGIHFESLDRYLISAARSKLAPVICLNKSDLAQDRAACRAALQPYRELGYPVLLVSARTGYGLDELRKVLRDKTTVLAGLAGVGKSSLLAALQPEVKPQFQPEPPQTNGGGKAVASVEVCLYQLTAGGFVVDMPGNAEFNLRGLRQRELANFYPEIAAMSHKCRFADCSHTHEPGCAVKQAVQQDRISNRRYHNYKKIYATLPA